MLSKSFLLYLALSSQVLHIFGATNIVGCYYSSWAVYRPGDGKFEPEDIDAETCTHIYYAFLGVNGDGTLAILDEWNEIELQGLARVSALKNINPNLKRILSIGGWNAGNAILKTIAADPNLRANLARSSIEFFKKYGYDGLDIDWEYPLADDRDNFIALLHDLKTAFQPEGYVLTAAVSAIPIDDAYDIPGMSKNLDIINLMTYDFHTAGAGVTGQNSPLYAGSADNAWQKEFENVNSTVVNWISRGADPQKLAIGLGFYGHTFTLADPSNHGVGAPVTEAGHKGPYTRNDGTLGYHEICELHNNDWQRVWDDQQKVPYRYGGDQWVGYDDPESIALKVQFAKAKNIGGVMIWSVDTDDFRGKCGTDHPLMKAIKDNL